MRQALSLEHAMTSRPAKLLFSMALMLSLAASMPRATPAACAPGGSPQHGGGLNACGCHFDRKTGLCHCHRPRGCGCACQPVGCP
jgi:hypothetical protein